MDRRRARVRDGVQRLRLRPTARRLLWRPTTMELVPEGNGVLALASLAKNVRFSLDYREDMDPLVAIVDYRVWASRLDTGEDVTDRLIMRSQQRGPTQVYLVVGSGDQIVGTTYRVSCTVVLSNDPPTELPGHFDLPCVE